MRIYTAFVCFLMLSIFYSCNPGGAGNDQNSGPATDEERMSFPLNMQKGGEFKSVDQIRVQARTIIEHRIRGSEKALAMLTSGYWWPEFVFNGSSMSKVDQYAGYWLRFNDDFTYDYGQYEKIFGKGIYHFNLDDKTLYMLDNNIELEPKVWIANYNGEVLALIGTHEYGVNNGMQVKMLGLEKQPSR